MSLVKSSFLSCVFMLLIYELLFTQVLYSRIFPLPENQTVANNIIAQKYIYERSDADFVIVGSSLSAVLRADLLPPQAYNLSFAGLSALDGLKIVLAAKTQPRAVFVETNVLQRNFDPYFHERLLSPWGFKIRRWMRSLRDVGRPLNVAANYLRIGVLPAQSVPYQESAGREAAATAILNRNLSLHKQNYVSPLSVDVQERLSAQLRKDVVALERRGINVVFFELPIHPDLCDLPLNVNIRTLVREQFPGNRFIRVADCQSATTTDGIHLTGEEARKITPLLAGNMR